MRRLLLPAALLPLAGCGVGLGGPPLASTQSPPEGAATGSKAEPQPLGSLPPGAATGLQPSGLAVTFAPRPVR